MWNNFAKAMRELRRIIGGGTGGSYRPDLHYMRGPGPKWHAKHAGFVAAAQSAQSATPSLNDVAERHV